MKKIFSFFIKNKSKIFAGIIISALIIGSYYLNYSPEEKQKKDIVTSSYATVLSSAAYNSTATHTAKSSASSPKKKSAIKTNNKKTESSSRKEKVNVKNNSSANSAQFQKNESVFSNSTPHSEPVESKKAKENYSCTFFITCDTILQNLDSCNKEKLELIPSDGYIIKPTKVYFNKGESVFDIIKRVCKENKIQFEYSFTPLYNSVYIEGINNIYELDVGELSGWMYKVNGIFENYGCSGYKPSNGDEICVCYTCNLGEDVGNPQN